MAIAWQFEPKSVFRTGFGIFSDILPGNGGGPDRTTLLTTRTFQGGVLGSVGGTAIAPGVPNSAVDATMTAKSDFYFGISSGQLSCASPRYESRKLSSTGRDHGVPDGKLHAPYFMEWSLGMEHQFGTTASVQARYVGTRAVNQPYSPEVNGYQTVCQGCFVPFPYLQPTDPRLGAVTQFSTGAKQPL